ncbi:GFA family protein [Ruegeria sp. 2205SS24-7]|uniref:GFA family protein n=1 Tax=Ruegeria discodermiae TaxID=3064389 RepID=UPI00274040DE|nr:GFA family protein [Ruegeria sp. 2205SS24-7]MDP5218105.1 GFA family protein [Ruegeria sp. 2205SS24-7]
MQVTGGCHCGAIRFEAEADPERTRICHCSDCQRLSGSPFRVVVPVSENDFRLTSGTPRIYRKTAASGAIRQQAFCADCGAPLYATSDDAPPRKIGIRVGALDQSGSFVPKRQFWTRSALDWLGDLAKIEAFDEQ